VLALSPPPFPLTASGGKTRELPRKRSSRLRTNGAENASGLPPRQTPGSAFIDARFAQEFKEAIPRNAVRFAPLCSRRMASPSFPCRCRDGASCFAGTPRVWASAICYPRLHNSAGKYGGLQNRKQRNGMNKKRGPFRFIHSREIYKNPWIRIREDKVIRPGGRQGIFGVIEMKSGSSVLALTKDRHVYLIKEYKYGIGRYSTEVMSGAIEESESPLAAAKRELKEELGLEAAQWINLGVVDPFTTVVCSPNYLFLALKVKEGARSPDKGEILNIVKVPFKQTVDMVMQGKITHSASCVLILKAEKYFRSPGHAHKTGRN